MFFLQCPDMEGVVNEDLPNSWECPKCCKEGKNVEYRVSGLVFLTSFWV
jgi:F-box/leucine-rich repeat protein 10/11